MANRPVRKAIIRWIVIVGLLLVPTIVYQSPNWIRCAAGLPHGNGLLVSQATEGDARGIEESLQEGASIEACDEEGYTPLHCAVMSGNARAVQTLIAAGANVSAKTGLGMTPLGFAVTDHNSRLVELLLKAHADPNQSCREGYTPLYLACLGDDPKVVELLIRAGANINGKSVGGMTPAIATAAASQPDAELFHNLIRAGADINRADDAGSTPLMEAAQRGRIELVLLLLSEGADPNPRNHEGASARMLAEQTQNWTIARLLSRAEDRRRA